MRSRRCVSSTARNSTSRRCRRERSSTRECCWPTRSASTTSICASRAWCRRWRWCTSGFRPTPSRRGTWRTRSELVCHNGEINTVRGNVNWIRARQQAIASTVLGEDLDKVWPLIYDGQSDSASFDNCLELLVMGGYPLAHAMMLMIPGGVGRQSAHGRRPARVLRVPRGAHGAMGRSRGDGVHRRRADRRDARPQWFAAGALCRHRR